MRLFDIVALAALVLGVIANWRLRTMSESLLRLRASVAAQASVIASAVALIGGISERIRSAADDEDATRELADELDAQTADLSKALATATPASGEVHTDDGGTGDESTAIDPDTVEIAEPTEPTPPAQDPESTAGGEEPAEG
jgi:hypothetical protein